MAQPATITLLETLRRYHLLDAEQLAALATQPLAGGADAQALARDLVRRELLTAFQINRVFQGKAAELLLGSYVLLDRLGEGGMGQVFKARNWKLGQIVALKLIRPERLANPDVLRRFQREIRAAAQLDHPNIVRALDADEVGGVHLFVMEYVEGVDLGQVIRQHGPLPIAYACDFVRQAALGLQHASERGLVHRDIKPANLLLTTAASAATARSASHSSTRASVPGVVKVLDLGLARVSTGEGEESSTELTQTNAVMGTPDYIAPEQALRSHEVDARADIYSLGCTLYHLLTGKVPFPGGALAEKLLKHQLEEPAPIASLRPEVKAGLAAVVARAMAKKPENRYQSPGELAEALAAGLASNDWPLPATPLPATVLAAARPAEAVAETPANWSELITPALTPPPLPRKKTVPRPWLPWAVGGGTFVVVLLTIVLLASRMNRPAGKPPTPAEARAAVVQVAADRAWQDTGIDVIEGTTVILTPSGVWRKGQTPASSRGLEKAARDRAVVPDAPFLCLLARIGDEPTPTPVTLLRQSLTPRRSGRLYLQVNDLDLADDQGTLKVEVEGGRAGSPVSAPSATPVQAADADLRSLLDPPAGRGLAEQRDDLLALLAKSAGPYQTLRARARLGEVLAKLPSPLDALHPLAVPASERVSDLPAEVVAVLGDQRGRHWVEIHCLALSPDGATLASGDQKGLIRLWDASTLRERAVLRGHVRQVNDLAFSPDGKTLASGSHFGDDTVRLWDLAGKAPMQKASLRHGTAVNHVQFSADGKMLVAGSWDREVVHVWDLGAGAPREKATLNEDTRGTRLALTPDGKTIVSWTSGGELQVWDLAGPRPRKQAAVPLPRTEAPRLALAPDGRTLFAGDREAFRLFDLTSNPPSERCSVARPPSFGAAEAVFSRDGKKLATCGQGSNEILLWEVTPTSLRETGRVRWHYQHATGLAFSPDGTALWSASADRSLRRWDLTASPPKNASEYHGHATAVRCVAFSPDGKTLASGGQDRAIRVWELSAARRAGQSTVLLGHGNDLRALAFAPDGRTLASAADNSIRLWDTTPVNPNPRAVLRPVRAHPGIQALAFGPDGSALAAGYDQAMVALYDLAGQAEPIDIGGNAQWARAVAITPDGRTLLASDNQHLRRWDIGKTMSKPTASLDLKQTILELACEPTGKTVYMALNNGRVRSWDLGDPRAAARDVHAGHAGNVLGLACSGDGRWLVSSGDDGKVIALDLKTRTQRVWSLPGPVYGVALAPDSRHVATGNANGTIYVLRLAPGERGASAPP